MSANYNTALLRQLQSPLLASLRKMEEVVGRVLSGEVKAADMDITKEAHEVASGLSMIGRQAIARLAHGISQSVRLLSNPQAQGWDFIHTQTVARHLQSLIRAFSTHLQDMINGGEELHARLWPLWVELARATEQPLPEVEDLFEVDPDFDDVTFIPRPLPYLQSTIPGAYDRLVSAIGLVEVARNDEDMERGLQKAMEVFTQLYGIRHRRAYQTYWLIVRARISVGLIRGNGLLDQRPEWLALLRDAGIQMRKFGEDHRRLPPEKIRSVLLPLLEPWPAEWASAHPVLAELDRRLGLSVFWRAVEEIKQEVSAGAAAQFSLRQAEIEQMVQQCRTGWNRVVSSIPEQRRAATAGFLRSLGAILGKREWFPGVMVSPLFDAFRALGDHLAERVKPKEMEPLPDYLALDVAASILLLEEIIERRVRWSKELEDRILAQSRRLVMAVEGRSRELGSLPMVRWDRKWHDRQVDLAIRQAIAQALVHADLIENSLADLFRGEDEDDIRARFDEFQARCRVVGLVLNMLRQPAAARLTDGLRTQIARLAQVGKPARSGAVEPVDVGSLAQAMASLSRFLHARRNGDADAMNLLAPGFDALWGQGAYQKMLDEMVDASPVGFVDTPAPPQLGTEAPAVETKAPAAPPSVPSRVDATPPRDLRAELLGGGAWDVPKSKDILPIFLEEASEALGEIEVVRSHLQSNPRDEEAWAILRRQFHTLKGSGRISGLPALGEVAWWVEERINEALMVRESYSSALDEAIGLAARRLAGWYDQVHRNEDGLIQASDIREALDAAPPVMGGGETEGDTVPAPQPLSEVSEEDIQGAWGESTAESGDIDAPIDVEQSHAAETEVSAVEVPPAHDDDEVALLPNQDLAMSLAIRKDAETRVDELASVLIQFELNGDWDVERLHVASHSLAALFGSAGFDAQDPAPRVARAVEDYAARMIGSSVPGTSPAPEILASIEWLRRAAEALAWNKPAPEAPEDGWFGVLSEDEQVSGLSDSSPDEEADSVSDASVATPDAVGDETLSEADQAVVSQPPPAEGLTDSQEDDEWSLDLGFEGPVDVLSTPAESQESLDSSGPQGAAVEESQEVVDPQPSTVEFEDERVAAGVESEAEPLAEAVELTDSPSFADEAFVEEQEESVGVFVPVSDVSSGDPLVSGDEPDLAPQADEAVEAHGVAEYQAAPVAGEDSEGSIDDVSGAPIAPDSPEPEASESGDEEQDDDEDVSARDLAWEKVFEAIDEVQAGFAKLSKALIELNDQDYRG